MSHEEKATRGQGTIGPYTCFPKTQRTEGLGECPKKVSKTGKVKFRYENTLGN